MSILEQVAHYAATSTRLRPGSTVHLSHVPGWESNDGWVSCWLEGDFTVWGYSRDGCDVLLGRDGESFRCDARLANG